MPAAFCSDEEENVLNYLSNDENDDDVIVEDPGDEKLEQEKAIWKSAGWTIDPCEWQVLGPLLLCMEYFQIKSEFSYILHFLPMNYIKEAIIPATNAHAIRLLGQVSHFSLLIYYPHSLLLHALMLVTIFERKLLLMTLGKTRN